MQQVLGKAEEERKISRRQVEELEARLTQLELTRRGLEGDMQRLRLVIAERDAENQVRWSLCSAFSIAPLRMFVLYEYLYAYSSIRRSLSATSCSRSSTRTSKTRRT